MAGRRRGGGPDAGRRLRLAAQRRHGLRGRCGPGYEHSLTEREDRAEAEQELRAREKRFATLDITPLAPASRQTYARQWATLQERFVDAPGPAVTAADELVTTVMAERGYPTEDFRQQLADLSVVHGRILYHYRQAHEISRRAAPGESSTEDLRQAMVHYRVLFEELLDDGDAAGGVQRVVAEEFGDQDGVCAVADELGGEGVAGRVG
ncbi:hypothetical protein [Nonomuraea jabiensis]|uniref:hypothetical protein n=1 Tax=Nonomuraea jabiensis TaxID=882448 RepID=UPI003F4E3845